MNRSLFACALVALVGLCRADEAKTDLEKPASPPLPAPEGLKFIDHGKKDADLKGLRTPEGFEVTVVMSFREHLRAVWFDDSGDLYLLRGGKKDTVGRYRLLKDGIGVGSSFEEENIGAILLHDGWLYIAGKEGVRRVRPGGISHSILEDEPKTVAKLPGVIGLSIGTDGWLYLGVGEGDHKAEGSDGSKADLWRSGGLFRCRPDGSKLHLFALGMRWPAGPAAFDLSGNLFHIDGDLPDRGKFTGCRLMHVPDQADMGYRLAPGAKAGTPDPHRAAAFGELPGRTAPLLKTGRGEPCGLFTYHDSRLPEAYRGLLLYPDPYDHTVRAYRVQPAGSTFKPTEEFSLLAGGDSFRPCWVATGPDGALYIVDRGDGKNGRLLRLRWAGTDDEKELPLRPLDSWAKLIGSADADLLKALDSADASDQDRAAHELARRGDRLRAALIDRAGKRGAFLALHSMLSPRVWTAFGGLTGDGDAPRLAAESLGLLRKPGDRFAHNVLLRALAEDDRSLKRAVALAMARIAGPAAADNLASAVSFDDGKDPVLSDGLLRALDLMGKPGIAALLALMDSGSQKDIDRTAEAFRGLRSRAAFDALPRLLRNPHLNADQRAALVRASVGYPFEATVNLEAIAGQVMGDEKEVASVKVALLEALAVPGVTGGKKAGAWALAQIGGKSAELRLAAIAAVARQRPDGAEKVLRARLAEREVSAEERKALESALRPGK